MSLTESRVEEALSTYAGGVAVTSADVERMRRSVDERIGRGWRPRRRLLLAAVAAALLALAAVVGGTLWLRRPTPVPATPQPVGSLTGFWKFTDPLGTNAFVIRADGTLRVYPDAQALVRHLTGDPGRVSVDGPSIVVDFVSSQGQPCRSRSAIVTQSEGLVVQGPQTYEGPGCAGYSALESTITRLSPASAATRGLPTFTEGPTMPVTDAVQLEGVWLLQGTGLVLAVDEKTGPAEYLLDDDGDIDAAPDARGRVSVQSDGEMVLADSGCGDSLLQRAEVRGQGVEETLTTTVAADPCNRFRGQSALTWIRVL